MFLLWIWLIFLSHSWQNGSLIVTSQSKSYRKHPSARSVFILRFTIILLQKLLTVRCSGNVTGQVRSSNLGLGIKKMRREIDRPVISRFELKIKGNFPVQFWNARRSLAVQNSNFSPFTKRGRGHSPRFHKRLKFSSLLWW